jgi:hypothetical protein
MPYALAEAYAPGEHDTHELGSTWPWSALYRPAAQATHMDAPTAVPYVPASHKEQDDAPVHAFLLP